MMGISYKTAELSIREQGTFSDTECLSFYNELLSLGISQAVIVSTCNRSELYFLYDEEAQMDAAKMLFLKTIGEAAGAYLVIKQQRAALLYLFEVCGGYHSLVPGEDQIVHQMTKAYKLSCECSACAKEMHKIFQTCFSTIRKIKAEYHLSESAVSIAYLAMQRMKQTYSLQDCVIGITGSGEMASLMRVYAQKEPFAKILLCNRTLQHLQEEENCELYPFTKRYEMLEHCDILVSATASPHVIWEASYIMKKERPLLLVDLAVPRDIDAAVRACEHITLWDMDDLQECVDEHILERKALMEKAHPMLEQAVDTLQAWLAHHACDYVFQTMQQRSEQMAQQTYELLNRKLSLSTHEQYVLKKVLHTSFLRMVKEPMLQLQSLKEADQSAYAAMLEKLFKGEVTS